MPIWKFLLVIVVVFAIAYFVVDVLLKWESKNSDKSDDKRDEGVDDE